MIIIIAPEGCIPNLPSLMKLFSVEHALLAALQGGGGDFEKTFPASACRKKKIASSTNVIESLWEKKGKKYPAHQIAKKKNILDDQKSPTPPLQELNGRPLSFSYYL